MAKSDAEKKKDFLKKHGLKRFNVCVIRTEGNKKGKVGILVNGKPKLIRKKYCKRSDKCCVLGKQMSMGR